ncbi:unnamed protein product [Staurois parvus]|uniref:Uncharacterized protein n=1 Tax=Staurois parvus TaxID=386267 RepID=A0ABN9DK54_9NEOB|nr:unnamed protein product [Staurois parvus]
MKGGKLKKWRSDCGGGVEVKRQGRTDNSWGPSVLAQTQKSL